MKSDITHKGFLGAKWKYNDLSCSTGGGGGCTEW